MKQLNAAATKIEFVSSIYKWLMTTLEANDKGEYKDCFKIEGSSIMCSLPNNYFSIYSIPENTRIEMKFITKR